MAGVLIVDDHATFRSFARRMLEASGFAVAGEAADGAGAIRAVHELDPELVLLDVQLPDIDGFEVARRLALEERPTTVVLVSSREASDYGERVSSSRAAGFIVKDGLSGRALRSLLDTP